MENSVDIMQEDDQYFALVEFKTVEADAAALLFDGVHCIDGSNFQVKAAEPWYQPLHINNALDDDCMRGIFSFLNTKALTIVAKTCVRFEELSKELFHAKHLKLHTCSERVALDSIKTFGSVAKSIDICLGGFCWFSTDDEKSILEAISSHCASDVLTTLKFKGFWFEPKIGAAKVFGGLKHLSFTECCLQNGLENMVYACKDLENLSFDGCRLYCDFEWPKFQKLNEVIFHFMSNEHTNFIRNIITRSPITKLSIKQEYLYNHEHHAIGSIHIENLGAENLGAVRCRWLNRWSHV